MKSASFFFHTTSSSETNPKHSRVQEKNKKRKNEPKPLLRLWRRKSSNLQYVEVKKKKTLKFKEKEEESLKSHINGEEEDYEETDKTLTEHS